MSFSDWKLWALLSRKGSQLVVYILEHETWQADSVDIFFIVDIWSKFKEKNILNNADDTFPHNCKFLNTGNIESTRTHTYTHAQTHTHSV
jgi:hypothetical protein